MKKILIFSLVIAAILLTGGTASAHWRPYFSFGIYLPPVAIWAPAPPPAVYPGVPPYPYEGPGYYGRRVWVPGYWESAWTPYGWRRVWIPGYWKTIP